MKNIVFLINVQTLTTPAYTCFFNLYLLLSISLCFPQHILAGCKETVSLSSHSAVILERIDSASLHRSSFLDSSSADLEEIPASVSSSGSTADLNGKLSAPSSAPSLKSLQKDVRLFSAT